MATNDTATITSDPFDYSDAAALRDLEWTPARANTVRRIIISGMAAGDAPVFIRGDVHEYLTAEAKAESLASGRVKVCRGCGGVLPIVPDGRGGLVTCEGEGCDMNGYTLAAATYDALDLSGYLRVRE